MAQCVKALANKPGDLNSIPVTRTERATPTVVLCPTHSL